MGSNVLIATPSNCAKNPNPIVEAILPNTGKQAAQLSAANQVPAEPIFLLSV